MEDREWLWDEPLGIPEAEDFGPGLSDAEVAAWEQRYGVPLPQILHRAYRQQDGGRVRDSQRGAALLRLKNVEPVTLDELSGGAHPGDDGSLGGGRLFFAGYDDTGANLLLHYAEAGAVEPELYAFYGDGGSLKRLAPTVDRLWRRVSR